MWCDIASYSVCLHVRCDIASYSVCLHVWCDIASYSVVPGYPIVALLCKLCFDFQTTTTPPPSIDTEYANLDYNSMVIVYNNIQFSLVTFSNQTYYLTQPQRGLREAEAALVVAASCCDCCSTNQCCLQRQ